MTDILLEAFFKYLDKMQPVWLSKRQTNFSWSCFVSIELSIKELLFLVSVLLRRWKWKLYYFFWLRFRKNQPLSHP